MKKGRGERRSIILILLLIGPVLSSAKSDGGSSGAGWTVLGNGDNQQYFSPLTDINDRNVAALGLAWYADIPSQDGLVGNPLVADGVVYQSGAFSRIYANDVRTGKLLWRFDPQIDLDGASLAAFWS